MNPKPTVIDISHHNTVVSWEAIKAAGIQAVILKATDGIRYKDPDYPKRRRDAQNAGLLVGAYHFCRNTSVKDQVELFLAYAKPDDTTLLAMDWENNPDGPDMSLAQAREFLTLLMAKTGRKPEHIWIYGGNVLKEQIRHVDDVAFFGRFPLWLCQYGPTARLPKAWQKYGLWQYSETGQIPGMAVDGHVDLNVFGGSDLAAEWAPTGNAATVTETADEPLVIPAADPPRASVMAVAKTAYGSRTTWAQLMAVASVVLGYVTDWAKQGWDWVLWAIGIVPEIYSEAKEGLTSAQEMTSWFGVNWKSISLTIAAVCIAVALWRHLNDKRKLVEQQS